MDWVALDKDSDEHVASLRRIEAKMLARRSLNESWCGHMNVTDVLRRTDCPKWVAACAERYKDSNEEHSASDYNHNVPAKDVLDREGLIDWLDHLTENDTFHTQLESFLDAVAFARALHRRGAVAPAREGLRVVKWASDDHSGDD